MEFGKTIWNLDELNFVEEKLKFIVIIDTNSLHSKQKDNIPSKNR